MTVKAYYHGPNGSAIESTSPPGVFETDACYVIAIEEGSQVFVWHGESCSEETKAAAMAHADTVGGIDSAVIHEKQGSESAEFTSVFPSLEYVSPKGSDEDDQEDGEGEAPATEAATGAAAAAGGAAGKKKKKKKNKKNGAPNAAAVAALVPQEERAAPIAAPTPTEEEKKVEEAAPDAAPAHVDPEETKEEEEPAKPTATEAAVVAELQEKLSPMKIAEPEKKEEETPVVASPPPPAAAAAAPQSKKEVTPVKTTPPPKKTTPTPSPAVKSTLSAAMPAVPAVGSKNPVVTAAKSYLADSAKAWGGVSDASSGQTPTKMDVKVAPGQKVFSYAELKDLKGDSGIDMTAKEKYLSEDEFKKVFNKDKSAFLAQPAWRQQLQKKEVGLF